MTAFFWIVGLVIVGAILLRVPLKQLKMGRHLTRMTNIFEEIERTRHSMPIGAGGGFDSLPAGRQFQANSEFAQGLDYLRNYPRHEVTRELVKNALLAERMGRKSRFLALGSLLDALVEAGVALDTEEFSKSYS